MTNPAAPLMKRPAVTARTTLSRTSIYRLIRDGAFPAPIQIGPRAVAWRLSDIEAWERSRLTVAPVAAGKSLSRRDVPTWTAAAQPKAGK